ncbi:arginyltransferase [Acinetobacter sp. c1-l78]|uniref:arginyltransferase n=1 Tax=Acinetobacter sp. c1-l78 TaxID=3342803 RepID=UPI0035B9700C
MALTTDLVLKELNYFLTPTHHCSYIKELNAQMIFLDPKQPVTTQLLSKLSRAGFRRSGDFIYRPECQLCKQCLSCRLVVQDFLPNSKQKKAIKRNKDLTYHIRKVEDMNEIHYALYEKYIQIRHADGDMYPPSREQFDNFLKISCTDTFALELWDKQQLICVAVCDYLDDGISAVYTFFDPDQQHRSLGVYSIISLIEYTKKLNLDYIYLGYWVPHAKKMRYKSDYQPLEVFLEERWYKLASNFDEKALYELGNSLMIPTTEIDGEKA